MRVEGFGGGEDGLKRLTVKELIEKMKWNEMKGLDSANQKTAFVRAIGTKGYYVFWQFSYFIVCSINIQIKFFNNFFCFYLFKNNFF